MTTALSFEAPEIRDGAASPVYTGAWYRGTVTLEMGKSSGYTFRACGPYGNRALGGFRSPIDAAEWLINYDNNGHWIS